MPPPFKADHVGSLIRPQYLIDARQAADNAHNATDSHRAATAATAAITAITANTSAPTPAADADRDLTKAQDTAIADAVRQQQERHIRPITSGEFERWIFYHGFFDKLSGISSKYMSFTSDSRPGLPQARQGLEFGVQGRNVEICDGPVRWTTPAYLDDWLHLRSLLPESDWAKAKVTLPSPVWFHIQRKDGTSYPKDVYANDKDFLADIAKALRSELMSLYEHGLRVAQIDDPNLTFFCEEAFVKANQEAGTDLDALLDMYIACHNQAIEGLPEDMAVGLHLCRGNYPGGVGLLSGGYGNIAKKLFRDCHYKLFYLEFDTERAGNFEPLAELPEDKAVVLGIVSSKLGDMEDRALLQARVMEAADVIAKGQGRSKQEVLRDSLAVSPQCGFASVNYGRGKGFNEEVMWKKLELVRDLAQDVWGDEVGQ